MNEPGLGDALKHEREKRDVSLDLIASKTNISIKALSALENDDVARIPGPFYLKNYIRNYLHAMDVDAEAFIETHAEKINAAFEKDDQTTDNYYIKLRYTRFKKKKNMLISLVLTLLIFIVVFYLMYTKKDDIFGGWNSNPDPVAVPQTAIDFSGPYFKEKFNRDFSPINISIDFTGKCWTQVSRGKNKIIGQTFKMGEQLTLEGYELTIYLHNPAALRFILNGKEVTYLKKRSAPETLKITPAGIEEILKR